MLGTEFRLGRELDAIRAVRRNVAPCETHSEIRRKARLKLKLTAVVEDGGSASSISHRPIATRSCDGV